MKNIGNEESRHCNKIDVSQSIDDIGLGFGTFVICLFSGFFFCLEAAELTMLSFVVPYLKTEWDLTSFESSLIASAAFFGIFLGSFFWGWFSDRFGRKDTIVMASTLSCIFGCLTSISFHYYFFILCEFAVGFCIGGAVVGFSFYIEFLPKQSRAITLNGVEIFWCFGVIIETGLSWFVLSTFDHLGWNVLVVLTVSPCLVCFFLAPFIPRSPRYLKITNQWEEVEYSLRWLERMNKINPKRLFSCFCNFFKYFSSHQSSAKNDPVWVTESINDETGCFAEVSNIGLLHCCCCYSDDDTETSGEEKKPILDPIAKGTLMPINTKEPLPEEDVEKEKSGIFQSICCTSSFEDAFMFLSLVIFYTAGSFGYYGVALASPDFFSSSNKYLGSFLISLAEVPGLLISSLGMRLIGRKFTQVATFLFTAFGLVLLLFPHENLTMEIAFGLITRGAVLAATCVTWVMAQESLSTSCRSFGCGVAAGVAKGATCLSPVIVQLFPENNVLIPKALFALALTFAGVLCMFYPYESKGKDLVGIVGEKKKVSDLDREEEENRHEREM